MKAYHAEERRKKEVKAVKKPKSIKELAGSAKPLKKKLSWDKMREIAIEEYVQENYGSKKDSMIIVKILPVVDMTTGREIHSDGSVKSFSTADVFFYMLGVATSVYLVLMLVTFFI